MSWKLTAVVAAIVLAVAALSPMAAPAADVLWNVPAGDFNDPANWSGGALPQNNDNASIQNGGTATISGDFPNVPNEIWVGNAGGSGTLEQSAGTVKYNWWFVIGRTGGGAGGTGTFNMKGGTLAKQTGGYEPLLIGDGNNTGFMTMSNNAVANITGEVWVGQGGSGTGTLKMNDTSSLNNGLLIIGRDGGNGTMIMNGDSVRTSGEVWVGQNWNSVGHLTVNGNARIDNNGWFVVGRYHAAGVLDMNGGVINKTGGGNVIVGSLAGKGTFNLNGGRLNNNAMIVLSEWADGVREPGVFNLNGGVAQATRVESWAGLGTFNFNGGTLQAMGNHGDYMVPDNIWVQSGGAVIDTNGYNVTITRALQEDALSTGGGLTKKGAGTLSLTGPSTYTGSTIVNAGSLLISGTPTMVGSISVKSGATLGGNTSLSKVVLEDGAVLAPGMNNIGTIRPANLAIGAATIQFELTNDPFGVNDRVEVLNDMNLVGTKIDVSRMITGGLGMGTYGLMTSATGTVSGLTLYTGLPAGTRQTFTLDYATPTAVNLVVAGATPANLIWKGDGAGNAWDVATSPCWDNGGTTDKFYTLDHVLFDDSGVANNLVTIPADVQPQSMRVSMSAGNAYTLQGAGKIIGGGGLVKEGAGTLTINNSNTFSGNVLVHEGEIHVGPGGVLTDNAAQVNVADTAGLAGKLSLDSGKLSGNFFNLATAAGSTGTVTAGGNSILTSNGDLNGSWDNSRATITLSDSAQLKVGGVLWWGRGLAGEAKLVLNNNSTFTHTGGWMSLGGSGTGHGVLEMNDNSILTGNDLNVGDAANGLPGPPKGEAYIGGTASASLNGLYIGKYNDSQGTMALSGSSVVRTAVTNVGHANNSVGKLSMTGSASLAATGSWDGSIIVGRWDSSNGELAMSGNASINSSHDIFIGRQGNSVGRMTMADSASVVQQDNWFFVGSWDNSKGTLEMSGGDDATPGASLDIRNGDINIGFSGTSVGQMTMKDYSKAHSRYWLWIGREVDSKGTLTMSGHSSYVGDGEMHIGAQGTGTIDASEDATLSFAGTAAVGEWGNNDPANLHVGAGHMTLAGNAKFSTGGEFWVGNGDPTTLDNTLVMKDNAQLSSTYWFVVGRDQGSGSMTMSGASSVRAAISGGNTIIGDYASRGSKLSMSDSATLETAGEFWVGQNTGIGTLEMSGDSKLSSNYWFVVGRDRGTGTMTMSGASSVRAAILGGATIIADYGSPGSKLTMSDTARLEAAGELWVGQNTGIGTLEINGNAKLTVHNWIAVGRYHGTGVLNMNGGEIYKDGGGNVIIGSLAGNGTFNMKGGSLYNNSMIVLSEWADGVTQPGIFNLEGGVAQATRVESWAGQGTFNFDGGTLQAVIDHADYMVPDNIWVKSGGAKIDSNGRAIRINRVLAGDAVSTGGGLTKLGAGTLTLGAVSTYSGNTAINAGVLQVGIDGAIPFGSGKGSVVLNGVGGPVMAGALDMNGHNVRINGLSGTMGTSVGQVYSSVAAPVTLTVGDADAAGAYAGQILDGAGPVALSKIGAGTQVLSGTNSYSGGTDVQAGTLQIASAGALPAGGSLTIGASGTVVLSSGLSAAAGGGAQAAAPVPEPTTLALLGVALAGLLVAAWRRNNGGK